MAALDYEPFDELVKKLTDGFEALLAQAITLAARNRLLQDKASQFQDQLSDFRNQNKDPAKAIPLNTNREFEVLTERISTSQQCNIVPDTISQLFASLGDPDVALQSKIVDGHKAWRIITGQNNTTPPKGPTDTPLSNELLDSYEGVNEMVGLMEYDRTNHGTEGNPQCPFSASKESPAQHARVASEHATSLARPGRLPTPPVPKDEPSKDPIEAELHRLDFSPPPSATGSTYKCPIRFLDQHSPEEVAKYFESHKHEIPRSHEVCVKRYQSNEASIRQLDAKYGNLVNMIQGLGMKHKPLLPQDVDQGSPVGGHPSVERVEAWAEEVLITPEDVAAEQTSSIHAAQGRIGRFDRELKEIRVGESPSRPWGISIPYAEGLALSTTSTRDDGDIVPQPMYEDRRQPCPDQVRPAGSCPFNRGAEQTEKDSPLHKGSKIATGSSTHRFKSGEQRSHPQMLFTGPVFIGYPPEQMAVLLREGRPETEKQ